jgi:hypothetical protein
MSADTRPYTEAEAAERWEKRLPYLPPPTPEHPLPWRWGYGRGGVVDATDAFVMHVPLWTLDDRRSLDELLVRINAMEVPS